jgi:plastocyanin
MDLIKILLAVVIVLVIAIATSLFLPQLPDIINPPTPTVVQSNPFIEIKNKVFNPSNVAIKVGNTVTWVNNDTITHNIVSDESIFSSGPQAPSGYYSFKFTHIGVYTYHCSIHPEMKGKITVLP